jgi:hypothetical protein
MVLPWVQRHGWILGMAEAYHGLGSGRPKRRREFLRREQPNEGKEKGIGRRSRSFTSPYCYPFRGSIILWEDNRLYPAYYWDSQNSDKVTRVFEVAG